MSEKLQFWEIRIHLSGVRDVLVCRSRICSENTGFGKDYGGSKYKFALFRAMYC